MNIITVRPPLRIGFCLFFILILHCSTMIVSRGLQKKPSMVEILRNIRSLPLSLTQIKEFPFPQIGDLLVDLKPSSEMEGFAARLKQFTDQADYLNDRYETLELYKKSSDEEGTRIMTLYEFANQSTSYTIHHIDHLNEFIETIIPRVHHQKGIFRDYSQHIENMTRNNEWCVKGQSVSYFIYISFQYTLDIIKRGFSVMLQSWVIRQASEEGNLSDKIYSVKKLYETTVNRIAAHFKELATGASTRLSSCDPPIHIRHKTYLEMEKLLQGIFPQEVTLNPWNSAKGGCEDYNKNEGTAYYPYKGGKHEGDWKCHGLMYNCFDVPIWLDICKPSVPNRRVDGFLEKDCTWQSCEHIIPYKGFGFFGRCSEDNSWDTLKLRKQLPTTFYESEQCACICDDFEHPKTMRKFSREYAMSDYRNNMVVTGIRIVNISNVIHIQIQEGKLEKFGFINSSTVQWRLKNDVMDHNTDLSSTITDEVVTLSYHKRRVNLDAFHFSSNEVLIGASFDWTPEMDGVELSAFVTVFSFSTGELDHEYRRRIASKRSRTEIILKKPHLPILCPGNIVVKGNDKFIKVQTSDWEKDAAQSTVPFVDIQEVAINPPTMLRGVGLYYKQAGDCGGYIGLELYSHGYENFIFDNGSIMLLN